MGLYLLSVHTTGDAAREPMTAEQMQELGRKIGELEQEMTAADALVYSGRLEGVESAAVIRVAGDETVVTDGPFAETKEHLGGFYIVEAADRDGALTWAEKTSACIGQPIEVRPFVAARAA
jgi:hypothetical protein